MPTPADELKETKHALTAERVRADRFAKVAEAERTKRKKLQHDIKTIEAAAFARGSALTVAHYMASWPDDGAMMWFQNLVGANVQKRPTDAAEVEKMVTAICDRYGVEIRDTRELIEMVYEPQVNSK